MPFPVKRYLNATIILMAYAVLSLLMVFSYSWSFKLPKAVSILFTVVVLIGLPVITHVSIRRYRLVWWFPSSAFLLTVLLMGLVDQMTADSSIALYTLLGAASLLITLPAALSARNRMNE